MVSGISFGGNGSGKNGNGKVLQLVKGRQGVDADSLITQRTKFPLAEVLGKLESLRADVTDPETWLIDFLGILEHDLFGNIWSTIFYFAPRNIKGDIQKEYKAAFSFGVPEVQIPQKVSRSDLEPLLILLDCAVHEGENRGRGLFRDNNTYADCFKPIVRPAEQGNTCFENDFYRLPPDAALIRSTNLLSIGVFPIITSAVNFFGSIKERSVGTLFFAALPNRGFDLEFIDNNIWPFVDALNSKFIVPQNF